MPSHLHEMFVEMFCERPALVGEILSGLFEVGIPPWQQVRVESADLTERQPTSYNADAVVTFRSDRGSVQAAIVEVQLSRDKETRYSWPVYLASLRARERCPTVLLVLCLDPRTAAWAATPIKLGHPGYVLAPLVIGPDMVPVITDRDRASQAPEMAVLSAVAHNAHPQREQIFQAMLSGLERFGRNRAALYTDIVIAVLPAAARQSLERLMNLETYEFQSDFYRSRIKRAEAEGHAKGHAKGEARGRAEGEARALLAVLEARGIAVPIGSRARIAGCTDLDLLEVWVRRAATIQSVDELFAD